MTASTPSNQRQGLLPAAVGPTVFGGARELARCGIESVRRLSGNVGLMVVRALEPVTQAEHAALAAFAMLCETRALIVDLRGTRDGDRAMAALLASHFFDTESACEETYWRRGARLPMEAPFAPRTRYTRRDVFILVDGRTNGAASALAGSLQSLGRATVVGARTEPGVTPDIPCAPAAALDTAHRAATAKLGVRDAA